MQQERRSEKRIKISYYVPVVNAESYEQLGILQEITTKGLQVDTQKVLPIDKPLKMRLDLSDEAFEKPFIYFTARPKWVKPDRIEPSFYNVGFEIIEITAEDSDIISRIMDRYAANKNSF